MKNQLNKTIAELIITREFLKLEIDKVLKELNESEASKALTIASKLNDINRDIMAINDLLRFLMEREKAL